MRMNTTTSSRNAAAVVLADTANPSKVAAPRLLLVDDEANILSSLRRAIHAMPSVLFGGQMIIESFDEPELALERAKVCAFDLVITDYRMPNLDGVAFLQQLIKIQPQIARMILSGYADLQALVAAINRVQISRFVSKPWDDFELGSAVAEALQHRKLLLENQRLADLVRCQQGLLSAHELERQRLEAMYPGITQVKRHADGAIDLEDDDAPDNAL